MIQTTNQFFICFERWLINSLNHGKRHLMINSLIRKPMSIPAINKISQLPLDYIIQRRGWWSQGFEGTTSTLIFLSAIFRI